MQKRPFFSAKGEKPWTEGQSWSWKLAPHNWLYLLVWENRYFTNSMCKHIYDLCYKKMYLIPHHFPNLLNLFLLYLMQ